jgi:hypothetical protein
VYSERLHPQPIKRKTRSPSCTFSSSSYSPWFRHIFPHSVLTHDSSWRPTAREREVVKRPHSSDYGIHAYRCSIAVPFSFSPTRIARSADRSVAARPAPLKRPLHSFTGTTVGSGYRLADLYTCLKQHGPPGDWRLALRDTFAIYVSCGQYLTTVAVSMANILSKTPVFSTYFFQYGFLLISFLKRIEKFLIYQAKLHWKHLLFFLSHIWKQKCFIRLLLILWSRTSSN